MSDKLKLSGILAAMMTSFNEDFSVDYETMRTYTRWLVDQGVHGVVVHADSGEGMHLSPEERNEVMRVVVEEVNGRVPVIAGLISSYTDQACDLAQQSERAGTDALMIFPIGAFRGQPLPAEVPYHYYKSIADAVNLPLVAFQLQDPLGGVEYSPEALNKILSIDSVIAIKESTFDAMKFVKTRNLVRNHQRANEISFLSGNDNFIMESLVLGADGCLIGFGTIASQQQVGMYNAIKNKDYVTAEKLNQEILPLCEAIFEDPIRNYRARTKVGLVRQGVLKNAVVRPPLLSVSEEEAQKVIDACKIAGLI